MKILKHDDGFTLIEALIAMVILTIGILAFNSMQIHAITNNSVSNKITNSSNLIQNEIEQIFPKSFGDTDFSDGTHNFAGALPASIESMSWTVVDWKNDGIDNDGDLVTDENDEDGIKEITFNVSYNNRGNIRNATIRFLKTEIL